MHDLGDGRQDRPARPLPGRDESAGLPLHGGELNAAITSAIVGIHTTFLGRGPRSASTFHHGPHVVCVLRDVLTRAEKVLAEDGRAADVSAMRLLKRQAMLSELRAAVERLTGRRVVASVGGQEGHPDVAVEVFLLDRPL